MDDSQTTPLIGRYIGLVQARDEDATFETGEIPDEFPKHGFWIKPRVLSDICTDSRVVPPGGGGVFGPVATVCSFETEEQAIILANDNSNGLASIVLTNNLSRGCCASENR